jgi:hypothetical protein
VTDDQVFSAATASRDDFARVVELCERTGSHCLIHDLAINAYVEPVYTMDADFVLAAERPPALRTALGAAGFALEDFPHSLNDLRPGSQLRIRFTRDARYAAFPERAETRTVLGRRLRVAALSDLVRGKVWAWSDPQRRLSKRKKDELDLIRLAERYPEQLPQLPAAIRAQLAG